MGKVLELTVDKALNAYKKGSENDRTLLENLYGKDVFSMKITDRVQSFEDACTVLGLDPDAFEDTGLADDTVAYEKLKVIAKALNEGWTPDWDNSNEYKYYPYFKMCGGFSFFRVGSYYTLTCVGSRLCFRSRELAEHAAKIGFDLYKQLYTI
ncbi:hypothetical protein JST56_07125 [Candidatus Dependentiae bacterium]|nr:hypothetical protein [Candidatus Dependentiae bacterium]